MFQHFCRLQSEILGLTVTKRRGSTLTFLLVSLGLAEVPPAMVYDVYFELVQFLGFLVFGLNHGYTVLYKILEGDGVDT